MENNSVLPANRRVAVYCITKNEEGFISRWAESAKDADYRIVVDTGSTDGTVAAAKEAGCEVHQITVSPWRFDDARNASLALIPHDAHWCIALDADEVLVPGWRDALESGPDVTRPRYHYTWSWNEDGTPGLTYLGDKIHTRHGYRWQHPVHEVLKPTGSTQETSAVVNGLFIHHFPDSSKSRSSYLPLLELSVKEDPYDDRNAHYLGREYANYGMTEKAVPELKRHLQLPSATWAPERAKSMRLLARCLPEEEETWLLRAAGEDPHRREVWLDLASFYYRKEQWHQCLGAAMRCLSITHRDNAYLSEAEAWGYAPHDLAAVAAWNVGQWELAFDQGSAAVELSPQDERLRSNLKYYQGVRGAKEASPLESLMVDSSMEVAADDDQGRDHHNGTELPA